MYDYIIVGAGSAGCRCLNYANRGWRQYQCTYDHDRRKSGRLDQRLGLCFLSIFIYTILSRIKRKVGTESDEVNERHQQA
jgi:hypothetical protein